MPTPPFRRWRGRFQNVLRGDIEVIVRIGATTRPLPGCPTPTKHRWELASAAQGAADYYNKHGRKDLEVYECPCGLFHLRSRVKRKTKNNRRKVISEALREENDRNDSVG